MPEHREDLEHKLLALIMHDIKIPLDNFASYLEHYKNPQTDQRYYEELISSLADYINSSRNLIDSMLFWVKQNHETYSIVRQPVLLRLQTDFVVSSLQYIAASKNLSVINHIPEMPQVKINLPVFEFVLRNLLSNSIKFSRSNGLIEIDERTKKDAIILSVSDQGAGIPPKKLAKILNFRARPEAAGNGQNGSGIGLILCNDLLRYEGGRIWAESAEDKGTTFYFSMRAEY